MSKVLDQEEDLPPPNFIVNTGAVMAVLLGIPSLFIGIFGFVGLITGQKLIAGSLGALWGYMAVAGAYELNRRKFDWASGSRHSDLHLLGGSLAVAVGISVGGALGETMPALAIIPAISAIKQANDGHDGKYLAFVHAALLAAGCGFATWLYRDGVIGEIWLARIAALP